MTSFSSDRLLGLLREAITEVAKALSKYELRSIRGRLRDLPGNYAGHETIELARFAADAVHALAFDNEGNPDVVAPAIMAVNTVLMRVLDPFPTHRMGTYRQLQELLETRPLDLDALHGWFDEFCGE